MSSADATTSGTSSLAERAAWLNPLRERIAAPFLEERERWILWSPVLIGIGIALYFALPAEPPFWIGGAALLAVFALTPVRRREEGAFPLLPVMIGLVAAGFAAAQYRTYAVQAPMIAKETRPVMVTGTVADIDLLPSGQRLTFENATIERFDADDTPKRLRVRLNGNTDGIRAGDRVSVLSILNPPTPPVIPGGFDYQRMAFFQQLGATGYAIGKPDIETTTRETSLENLRQHVTRRIGAVIGDEDTAAVATALMTGERRQIREAVMEDIRKAGIAHLLAISGLHIGMVAAALFFFLRAFLAMSERLALRYSVKKIAAFVTLLGTIAYTMIVGAPVPAQRAAMMTGIVLVAVMLDRAALTMRLVALAATVILLLRPENLLGASFHMSFAAVVALIAFYEAFSPRWKQWYAGAGRGKRVALYFTGCMLTTVIASFATAPYALFHFQRVPFIGSLLANMIAVPLAGFVIMPMALLAYIVMPFGLESWPLWAMGWGTSLVLDAAHDVATSDYSIFMTPAWPVSALCVVTLGGLWLALWQGRIRWLGVLPMVAGVVMAAGPAQPDVLVSADGELMAVKTRNGGYSLSQKRRSKFVAENWLEAAGLEEGAYWPWRGVDGGADALRCDPYGCTYAVSGKTVSLVRDPLALTEDCGRVAVLITPDDPEPWGCKAAVVVNVFDLKREGAHALYFGENGSLRTDTVAGLRGNRPWTVSNGR